MYEEGSPAPPDPVGVPLSTAERSLCRSLRPRDPFAILLATFAVVAKRRFFIHRVFLLKNSVYTYSSILSLYLILPPAHSILAFHSMSLVSRALTEYQLVNERNNTTAVQCPPPPVQSPFKHFDFNTDEERPVVPIHQIEESREKHRRSTWGKGDIYETRQDFASAINIDPKLTVDPESHVSVLDVCPGKRAYDGDPIEESYRALRYAAGPVVANVDWMKQRHLLGDEVAIEYARMKWSEAERWAINYGGDRPADNSEASRRAASASSDRRLSDRVTPAVDPTPLEVIFPTEETCDVQRPKSTTKQRFLSEFKHKKNRAAQLHAAYKQFENNNSK
eukprot:gene13255-9098_t